MWIAIISAIDKVLGIFANLVPFWIKRADKKSEQQQLAEKEMRDAVEKGDLDAYWNARSRRNCA